MSKNNEQRYQYTQNRELSWLRFNQRVLEEASDPCVPALERLKFIAIFSSNLDEFFMVRVGSLFDLSRITPDDKDNKTGWTPKEQLEHVYREIPGLLEVKQRIYATVTETLGLDGIEDISMDKLNEEDKKQINCFFKTDLLPVLSPILIGANHPVPHLVNKRLYAAAMLENKKGHKAIGIVPVPDTAAPYILLSRGTRFVRTENIILDRLPDMFDSYRVKESCILAVTRNADISFDDEKFEDSETDLRRQMKKLLKQRDHLAVVRLEINTSISKEFHTMITMLAGAKRHQTFVDLTPINMSYVFNLIEDLPKEISRSLLYTPYNPRWAEDLDNNVSILQQVQKQDRMLFYPYDSVYPFLSMMNEAAENPRVLSIKITIYRLASSSKIAQVLCRAAENGKEVIVLMELRARFDEANNISWAKMLEESGCQVIYGTEGFKCHSKICLITLRSHNKTDYITQIGTGNYNEKTNAMYTDLSLITANRAVGEDAAAFFRNMLINKLDGDYKELCVSPYGIKSMLLRQIDRQIAMGEMGYICIKANSVTEREVMDKLMEASCAGVEVQLIIRGICCILPGVSEYTENIHVTSIVGQFLEHARIYMFGRDENAEIYISSADLMTRNLNRRVEIACPVYERNLREQLKWILTSQLRDTAKASSMLPDGSYSRKNSVMRFDSQSYFMQESPHIPAANTKPYINIFRHIKQLAANILEA